MIANGKNLANKGTRVGRTLVAVAALMSSSLVWADPERQSPPVGVYVGLGGGFAPSQRECRGASDQSCERVTFAHKFFAGWRMTPGLAAELNHFYFNGIETTYTQEQNAVVGQVRESAKATTFGIDWSVELLQSFTNHLKFGVARLKTTHLNMLRSGGDYTEAEYKTAPYVGAGLSFSMTNNLRFDSGFDYIINGHESRYLFGVGLTAEY